jgi:hypothetical protein
MRENSPMEGDPNRAWEKAGKGAGEEARGEQKDRSPKHTSGHRHGCSRQGLTRFTGRRSPGPRKSELNVAEREGFEPSVRVNAHTLSKRAP